MPLAVIRGSGDIGSAVAHALFAAGLSVVVQDDPSPSHTRRRMSFVDALYDGTAELEGTLGKRALGLQSLVPMVDCRRAVPLTSSPFLEVAATLKPDILVDARMRKRDRAEVQISIANLTIGVGPGFIPGRNVHVAIETEWGDRLGAVLCDGETAPLRGEPREIGGVARERFIYAPQAGIFSAHVDIGARVEAGQIVARIGPIAIRAPLAGYVRGISHTGARVRTGIKVLEMDPRAGVVSWLGIGERPRRVAEGVMVAMRAYLRSA